MHKAELVWLPNASWFAIVMGAMVVILPVNQSLLCQKEIQFLYTTMTKLTTENQSCSMQNY